MFPLRCGSATEKLSATGGAVCALNVNEMSNDRKEEAGGMDLCDDEALWRLLGRARGAEVSRIFRGGCCARRHRQRAEGRAAGGIGRWLVVLRRVLRRPRVAVWPGAMAVAVFWLAVVVTTSQRTPSRADHPALSDFSSTETRAGQTAAAAAADQGNMTPLVATEGRGLAGR